jgi:nucleoside-diphosphate-sugar epimerase
MLLITGATGFIGSHLLEHLASTGRPARLLLRRKRLPAGIPDNIQAVYGDLATGQGIDEALDGIDAVIHLAGVTKALRNADYHTGNVAATETLARRIAGRGVRFVHVSSLAAMGPCAGVDEDAEPKPISHYGISKLEAERKARAYVPEAVIVRPPVVYGPRDTDVFQMLKSAASGFVLEIAGGDRWFSAIYVKDLVQGLIAAVECPKAAGRTYFLTHPKPLTWKELSDTAARIMGRKPPKVITVPYPIAWTVGLFGELWSRLTRKPVIVSRDKVTEARCAAWTCSAAKAASELGFEAKTGLERGLSETLEWYKGAGWLRF